MKAFSPLLLSVLMAASLSAAPIASLSTLTGKTYHQCEIVKVYPDGVSFTHANGAAKVAFTDLSQEWRTRLGYDPAKAKAYQREQAERREQQAETRRKHEEEVGEALIVAQQMELSRLRGNEVQARAALEQAAQAPFPETSLVPVLPDLGAVHDSSDFRGAGYRDRPYGFYPGAYGFGGYSGYGYGYGGGYPIYRDCSPYYGGYRFGGFHGRVGGVSFTIGR